MDWIRTRILPTPQRTSVQIAVKSNSASNPRFSREIQIHECAAEDPALTSRILELLDAGFAVVLRTNTGWEHIILPRQHDHS